MNRKPCGGWSRLAIRAHLQALHEALREGANVHGYFTWSLFDNFEWERGYGPRFGLVRVNYNTQERIPKQSACWFSDLIQKGAITV